MLRLVHVVIFSQKIFIIYIVFFSHTTHTKFALINAHHAMRELLANNIWEEFYEVVDLSVVTLFSHKRYRNGVWARMTSEVKRCILKQKYASISLQKINPQNCSLDAIIGSGLPSEASI